MPSHVPLKPFFNLRVRTDQLIREPFPYYLDDPLKNTILSAAYSAAVVALLAVIQNIYVLKVTVVGLTTFGVLYVNIVHLPRLFPTLLDPGQWTVGKYITFSLWQMLLCAIAIPVACHFSGIHPEQTFVAKLVLIFPKIFFYGAIPQIILTLVIRNFMLKESLRQAHLGDGTETTEEVQTGATAHEIVHSGVDVTTIRSDTRETLAFPGRDWLFAEANDNYVTFYWQGVAGTEKRMLRMNMKSAEDQLAKVSPCRCHRSYLVNLNAVKEVTGNSNGYKLQLKNHDGMIPVSRNRGKEVLERFSEMNAGSHSPQNPRC